MARTAKTTGRPGPRAELGRAIVVCRNATGLSQEALAARVGTQQGTLLRWEHGKQLPGDEPTVECLRTALTTALNEKLAKAEEPDKADLQAKLALASTLVALWRAAREANDVIIDGPGGDDDPTDPDEEADGVRPEDGAAPPPPPPNAAIAEPSPAPPPNATSTDSAAAEPPTPVVEATAGVTNTPAPPTPPTPTTDTNGTTPSEAGAPLEGAAPQGPQRRVRRYVITALAISAVVVAVALAWQPWGDARSKTAARQSHPSTPSEAPARTALSGAPVKARRVSKAPPHSSPAAKPPRVSAPAVVRTIALEAESNPGDYPVMPRSEAYDQATVWLHNGQSLTLRFTTSARATYSVNVRWSNDGPGLPPEHMIVAIDGTLVGSFVAENTRPANASPGDGWNVFASTQPGLGPTQLAPGSHAVTVTDGGGDENGVEIDRVALAPV